MRVLLLGRKPVSCAALRYVLKRGATVVATVAPPRSSEPHYGEQLCDVALAAGIPLVPEDVLYSWLADRDTREEHLGTVDAVFSITHQKRILRPLITLPSRGCINFHPGPLPEYRGWGGATMAILEGAREWGAAAHFIDDDFDTGPLVRQDRFPMDGDCETAFSLERRTQPILFGLFKAVFEDLLAGRTLPKVPQGIGRSFRKLEVLARREIMPTDSPELVERKIRAFWFPPYVGAYVRRNGNEVPVLSEPLLQNLAHDLHGAYRLNE